MVRMSPLLFVGEEGLSRLAICTQEVHQIQGANGAILIAVEKARTFHKLRDTKPQ